MLGGRLRRGEGAYSRLDVRSSGVYNVTMHTSLLPIDDHLIAAILAVGLRFGVLRKRDLISWADQEIEQRSEVPAWLIDLSLSNSKDLPSVDIVKVLEDVSRTAIAEAVCIGIYSLIPDIADRNYEQCHIVARLLYHITRTVLRNDFSSPLLLEMVTIDEVFDGWQCGSSTHEELMTLLRDFVELKRDKTICSRLKPIIFVIPDNDTVDH